MMPPKKEEVSRPPTVKADELKSMDVGEDEDDGWAGHHEEVDYTKEVVFEDSSDDESPSNKEKVDKKPRTRVGVCLSVCVGGGGGGDTKSQGWCLSVCVCGVWGGGGGGGGGYQEPGLVSGSRLECISIFSLLANLGMHLRNL